MKKEQEKLLKTLAHALFDDPLDTKMVDWDSVLFEAEKQAVFSIVYGSLIKGSCTEKELYKWNQKAYIYRANNVRVLHSHALLNKWLKTASIPYVVIKGASSAYYYSDPFARTMGDVDFLVPKEYIDETEQILESNHLTRWKENHDSHIVFRNSHMHFEMHFDVAGIPEGVPGELIRGYLQDIFENSQECRIGDDTVTIPSTFHHGLILLLHTIHHMTGEGIGLRHLCDWAVFVSSVPDKEFIHIFENKLKQVGLWKFAKILTQMSIVYLGVKEKEWAVIDDNSDIVAVLMEDFLESGNFGIKDRSRARQTILISSRGKGGVGKKPMAIQFVQSMNHMIRLRWPIFKEHVILLPIGWLMYLCRYLWLILCGKKKVINGRKLVKEACRRRDLYSQLQLYEVVE